MCVLCVFGQLCLTAEMNEIFSCDAAGKKNLKLLSKSAKYLTATENRKLAFE